MLRAGGPGMLDVQIRDKIYHGASGQGPEQSHKALADLTLHLETGLVGAIVGPSGCGKTTLLRLIAGLDHDFAGTISLPAGGRLAMVFQEPRLLPWRNVEANIRIAAPDLDDAELSDLLAALSLSAHRHHFPGELSLGLARRVALLRALAVHPDILLLDEPFASLDAAMAERLLQEISALVTARAVTTVLVTHDVETAIRLADRIFVLSPRPARVLATLAVSQPRQSMTMDLLTHLTAQIRAAQMAV